MSQARQLGLEEPAYLGRVIDRLRLRHQAFSGHATSGKNFVIACQFVATAGAAYIQGGHRVHVVIAQRGGLAFHGAFSFRGLTGYRGRRFRAFCRFCGVRSTTSGPECHRCREFVALPRWIKKRRLESGGHGSRSSKENEENRRDRVSTRRSVPLAGRSAVIQSAFWRRTQGNGCPGDRERLWMPAARRAPLPPCRRSRSRSPITDDVFAAAGK